MRRTCVPLFLALLLAASPGAASAVTEERTDRPVAPAPAWFTPEFAQRVIDAGPEGAPLPSEAQVPTSSLAFLGIRPGQQIIITDDTDPLRWQYVGLCTSNFVFRDGSNFQIGTAGHCGEVGDKVFMIFAPLGVAYIGDIVRSWYVDDDETLAPDFALIAIRPEFNEFVSPSMAHWGGPTGAYTGSSVEVVLHSGHGIAVGTGGTPRAGVAYQWGDEWRFAGAISPGDSGSAAIVAGGLAAGNITHLAANTGETIPAWAGGTSITKILSLTSLPLATCPTAIPWPLPGCPPV